MARNRKTCRLPFNPFIGKKFHDSIVKSDISIPNTFHKKLIYCNPSYTDDCTNKTNGLLQSCYSTNRGTKHVCVPKEKDECNVDNPMMGIECPGIGIEPKLESFCKEGKCQYGRIYYTDPTKCNDECLDTNCF